jgi:hypothetical protein
MVKQTKPAAAEDDERRALPQGLFEEEGAPRNVQRAASRPRAEKLASGLARDDARRAPRMRLEHVESEHARVERLPEDHYEKHILPARRAAYDAELASMTVPAELAAWAERMELRFGFTVRVWFNRLPWLAAFLVVRYGEAIDKWPDDFHEADVTRALEWERDPFGKRPNGVVYSYEEAL